VEERNSTSVGVILLIIAIIIINIIALIACRIYVRNKAMKTLETPDVKEKIDLVVTNYLALRDSSSK